MPATTPTAAVVCKLKFVCDQRWDQLSPIDADSDIRFCGRCQEPVYWCEDHTQLVQHAQRAHCVAIPSREPDGMVLMGDLGVE